MLSTKAENLLSSIRILVADDYEAWRRQACLLLQARPELQVICEASDGSEAVQKAEELKPDLILLDMGLPKLNGIEAARRMRQLSPNSKIVFLSQENSPDIVEEALRTCAQGYVHKARAQSDLLPAIDAVLRGKEFDSSVLKNHKFTNPPAEKTSHSHELLFFSDDRVLLDSFSGFIAAALKAANAAIVLVTKSHQEMLHQRLKADGVDVDGAIRQGTYISLDLADTLAKLMVAGLPDPVRFVEDFSGLVDATSKATKAEHPRVAFCGECIGRLWAEGKTDAALQLEQACNDLAKTQKVDMLCAYPTRGLRGEEDERVYQIICVEHSAVHY